MSQVFFRCAALLLITVSGCATWHTTSDKPSQIRGLPAPRRHPSGALLEVAFISIGTTAMEQETPNPAAQRSAQLDHQQAATEDPEAASASDLDELDLNELDLNELEVDASDLDASDQIADELHASSQGAGGLTASDRDASNRADSSDRVQPFQTAADVAVPDKLVTGAAQRQQEDIWNWIDETVVPPEVRHALRRNGLRIGKAQRVGDFAQRLNQIRRQQDETNRLLEIAEVESDLSHQSRKISCRIGKRYELPVRQPAAGEQAVLVTLGGQTLGKTLSQAQPLFALRANTADVSSIKLSLRPEIQHGVMRQAWVGSDAALRIDNRRDAWTFDELVTEIRLEKGGMLVAGCIHPPFGLGQHMFTGTTADGDADQVLMVVRVADLPELIEP